MRIEDLKVEIYADGADIQGMKEMYERGIVKGFTTNPSLMKKAGVSDYAGFAREATQYIPDMPISFEVFSDDFRTMEKEALILSGYGPNVFVKIPIMNAEGASSIPLIKSLSEQNVNLNITAVFTLKQVTDVLDVLSAGTKNIISVFAGRIADAGVDPEEIMRQTVDACRGRKEARTLWASCREVFNVVQADRCGTDIITVTNDLLKKLDGFGKDLEQRSLETVQMFAGDARSLGFTVA